MFDGKFRVHVDKYVRPVGVTLTRTKITPDHLTVVGLVIAVAAAVAIGAGYLRLGLLLVIAAALPDMLDGALAKASNVSSQRGAFFDSTPPSISESVMRWRRLVSRRHARWHRRCAALCRHGSVAVDLLPASQG